MISMMIKSRNIKNNCITRCGVNAGCTEVLMWSCVEIVHMVVCLLLWSALGVAVRSVWQCVLVAR
jgi:hypothetical protein